MRLLLILLLTFTGMSAFAAEIPTRINDSVRVSKDVSPDVMSSFLNVQYNDSDFKSASSGIEKIAAVIKAHADTCTFASYRINPKYTYFDNKRKLTGYQASLNSPCSFTDIVEFDAVLNDISTVTSSDKSYVTSVSPVVWQVSEDRSASVKDTLKTAAISSINEKRDLYSKATDKTCYVSMITFGGANPPVDSPLLARAMTAEAINSTPPDRNTESISITANFNLICK